MDRRSLLRAAVLGTGTVALGFSVTRSALAYPAQTGTSPYGALQTADANGIMLPQGFTSRVIARSTQTVASTEYTWHSPRRRCLLRQRNRLDLCLQCRTGQRRGQGQRDQVRQQRQHHLGLPDPLGHQPQLRGRPPWNTWISCEEVDTGYCWETDPWGVNPAVRRAAMGRFNHEAAACDRCE